MTCQSFQSNGLNGFLCGGPEYVNYICFEHTTYLFEFSKRFGPHWWRLEGNKEIEVEFEFNEEDEVISNEFLWKIFEDWQKGTLYVS